jgi:hypothetical protein
MIIRAAQMQQLQETQQDQFRRFMIGFLRESFYEESNALSDAELAASIDRHSLDAEPYAINDENSLAKFIYLKWLLGEEFEELPDRDWLVGLLEDRTRPALHRMEVALSGVEYQFEHYQEMSAAA